jgi:hypothetical protein
MDRSERKRGGKDGEQKLLEIFLAKDQKDLSVGDKDRSAHFFFIKARLTLRRIALQRFRAAKKLERELGEGKCFMVLYALSLMRQASEHERLNHWLEEKVLVEEGMKASMPARITSVTLSAATEASLLAKQSSQEKAVRNSRKSDHWALP